MRPYHTKADKNRPIHTSVLHVLLLWHHHQLFTNVHNPCNLVLTESSDSGLEEVPDKCITYCTTSAVESKLKKASINENVILGGIRDMANDDDAVLEGAADTAAKQLADGWLTCAKTR